MTGQNGVDDRALHADPTAMDQPDVPEAPLVCGHEVLLDDRGHVTRRERVKVEGVFDRQPERFFRDDTSPGVSPRRGGGR